MEKQFKTGQLVRIKNSIDAYMVLEYRQGMVIALDQKGIHYLYPHTLTERNVTAPLLINKFNAEKKCINIFIHVQE